MLEAYDKFEFKNELSFISFYRYVKLRKIFKKPHRRTDMCGICLYGKQLKKQVLQVCLDFNFKDIDYTDFNAETEKQTLLINENFQKEIKKKEKELFFLNSIESSNNLEKTDEIKTQIENISKGVEITRKFREVLFHKKLAKSQRDIYNSNKIDASLYEENLVFLLSKEMIEGVFGLLRD